MEINFELGGLSRWIHRSSAGPPVGASGAGVTTAERWLIKKSRKTFGSDVSRREEGVVIKAPELQPIHPVLSMRY